MTSNGSEVTDSVCEVWENVPHRVLRATYIGVDLVLTMFGNVLTIVVTRKVEEFSDSTKMMFTSLALADLGVAFVAATSFAAEISGGWIFPMWICEASFISFYIFTAVSVFMLVIMTFDRLVAVVRPLRYSLILTKGRSLVAIAFVWLACTVGAIFTTITNQIIYNKCSALCSTKDRNILQSVVAIVTYYFIPLTLIVLMNVKLLSVAHQHARRFRNQVVATPAVSINLERAHVQHHPRSTLRGKAVGVVTLVTFAFIVSWSLFYVKLILNAASDEGVNFPEGIEFASIWLGLTNSWWNVIMYSVMNRSFRQHLKSVLRRLCSWLPERFRDICRR
ncbi:D(4) dopamine receptor-like [Patiria miniata]|uniref:G-protein coupled receptors family 1 profile domain-containing protein n=1 Tax=Patiria miniata TaxID=46514 RepID=A0A913YZH9_PATMI|nr:D(4) dopamine receptor-like [Patiria miniata]XP_038045125.1 D(4) dopamine receptor-like [Patiria miniata]